MRNYLCIVVTMFLALILNGLTYAEEIQFSEKKVIGPNFDGAYGIYVADVNGDGFQDVLGANAEQPSELAWWSNTNGDGSIWEKNTIADEALLNPGSIVTTDIDNDGDMDVFVNDGSSARNDIILWKNIDGIGTSWEKILVEDNFLEVHSISLADIDGDGDMDVLGAATTSDKIAWWENADGDGSAWNRHDVAQGFDRAISVHAADINLDGNMDIIGTAYQAAEVAWFENPGNSESLWTKHLVSSGNPGARYAYAVDIDNDGDDDIIGAVRLISEVAWWENPYINGDGSTWVKHSIDASFGGAYWVFAEDIDGDGDMDVLGAASYDHEIAWWKNPLINGDGITWVKQSVDTNFIKPFAVYSSDLDDDGRMDIIAAAFTGDEIAWWRNQCPIFMWNGKWEEEYSGFWNVPKNKADVCDSENPDNPESVCISVVEDQGDSINPGKSVYFNDNSGTVGSQIVSRDFKPISSLVLEYDMLSSDYGAEGAFVTLEGDKGTDYKVAFGNGVCCGSPWMTIGIQGSIYGWVKDLIVNYELGAWYHVRRTLTMYGDGTPSEGEFCVEKLDGSSTRECHTIRSEYPNKSVHRLIIWSSTSQPADAYIDNITISEILPASTEIIFEDDFEDYNAGDQQTVEGDPCESAPNNCGDTNDGVMVCAELGVECDAIAPDDRPQVTVYMDADGDGYGDINSPVDATCGMPSNAVEDSSDCNDNDDAMNPGLEEICDLKDNDCNGFVDDGVYVFGGFEQPINPDGSSIFKAGRTIPVKISIADCGGTSISTANVTIAVYKITDLVLGSEEELELDASGNANTGNTFRQVDDKYIFNLSTKGYSGGTYKVYANPDDGSSYSVIISLK